MTLLLVILISISIWYSWQSFKACMISELLQPSLKEVYKIMVSFLVLIYIL